ncbi:MAG: hypothetical protein ACLR2E_10965 [Lachnospiraceae bacterium]
MNGSKVVESIDSSGADYETETEPDTALPYVNAFSKLRHPHPGGRVSPPGTSGSAMGGHEGFQFPSEPVFHSGRLAAIDESLLDVDNLMEKDLAIDTATDGPQMLSLPYPLPGSLRRFQARGSSRYDHRRGERLKRFSRISTALKCSITMKVYDMIDGKLDRNKAYNLAAPDIEAILKAYPSIRWSLTFIGTGG